VVSASSLWTWQREEGERTEFGRLFNMMVRDGVEFKNGSGYIYTVDVPGRTWCHFRGFSL
jgi:hypothetical protein